MRSVWNYLLLYTYWLKFLFLLCLQNQMLYYKRKKKQSFTVVSIQEFLLHFSFNMLVYCIERVNILFQTVNIVENILNTFLYTGNVLVKSQWNYRAINNRTDLRPVWTVDKLNKWLISKMLRNWSNKTSIAFNGESSKWFIVFGSELLPHRTCLAQRLTLHPKILFLLYFILLF